VLQQPKDNSYRIAGWLDKKCERQRHAVQAEIKSGRTHSLRASALFRFNALCKPGGHHRIKHAGAKPEQNGTQHDEPNLI